jgi:hypothetical protein
MNTLYIYIYISFRYFYQDFVVGNYPLKDTSVSLHFQKLVAPLLLPRKTAYCCSRDFACVYVSLVLKVLDIFVLRLNYMSFIRFFDLTMRTHLSVILID